MTTLARGGGGLREALDEEGMLRLEEEGTEPAWFREEDTDIVTRT